MAGSGIGLACGYGSLIAFDIDTQNPEIVAAIDTVIPSSPLTKRGAKGETRFFRATTEPISRSFTSRPEFGSERIIDVLGMGRQTVIPPTHHPETGMPYEWVGGATIFEVPAESLPLLPADFLDRLEQALGLWLAPRPAQETEDHGYGLRPPGPIGEMERKRYEGYFKTAFTERLKELATTSEGSRNEELYRLACYLGKYVLYGIAAEEEFFSGLEEACTANGLVRQDGLPAVRATIKSGLRASRNDALPLLEERHQGAEKAETATSAKASDPWPEMRPLVDMVQCQPYPLHALPMLTLNAVQEVQGFVQAPIEMVAMSALSAMSAALQAHRNVRRSSKLVGPISLWHLTIAESGERKTSLDRYFSEAIRDHECRKAKEAAPEIKKAKDQAKNWTAQEKGLLAALTKARKDGAADGDFDISQIEEQLDELRANTPIMPRVPLILRGDDTSESLAYSLSHEWPSAAVLNSEAGLIFGSHAMGPEKVMAALAQKNVFWDGGDLHIGRRTSESFAVRGARFTFGLQIQRAALWNFVQKSGEVARGIGFWARFLFPEPESTQGTRLWKEPPKTWVHLAK
jgi:putative DNA primase/helicase